MSLTPEQFNKLVTKKEHQKLEKKVDLIVEDVHDIKKTLDFIVKNFIDHKTEHTANQSAHDRMQGIIDRHEIKIKKFETKTI